MSRRAGFCRPVPNKHQNLPALPGNSSPLRYSASGPCRASSRAQCTPDLPREAVQGGCWLV